MVLLLLLGARLLLLLLLLLQLRCWLEDCCLLSKTACKVWQQMLQSLLPIACALLVGGPKVQGIQLPADVCCYLQYVRRGGGVMRRGQLMPAMRGQEDKQRTPRPPGTARQLWAVCWWWCSPGQPEHLLLLLQRPLRQP